MSDLPGEAVTAGLQAMRKHSREAEDHDDFISECCVTAALAAAAPHIDAAARASERERIRRELLNVVTANVTAGNDTVYGALLDAIRELGQS